MCTEIVGCLKKNKFHLDPAIDALLDINQCGSKGNVPFAIEVVGYDHCLFTLLCHHLGCLTLTFLYTFENQRNH